MTYLFVIIIQWIFVLVLLTTLILLFWWMYSSLVTKNQFISVPTSILPDIEKALDIKKDSVIYDLGSGDARVLLYIARKNPKARYIGLENGSFPFAVSKFLSWFNHKIYKTNIELLKKDFFEQDLSNATHIFTYLYPKIMDDMLGKFDRELKPGTKLVSTTFKFTLKAPIQEIDLNRGKNKLARKLYVYEF